MNFKNKYLFLGILIICFFHIVNADPLVGLKLKNEEINKENTYSFGKVLYMVTIVAFCAINSCVRLLSDEVLSAEVTKSGQAISKKC